jgi:hypothetical protein
MTKRATPKGPWSADRVERFLAETEVPLRLACNGASGHPVMASLWFLAIEGTLWCATPRDASVAARLRDDGRCAFEVSVESPPYRGVRGTGVATLHDERGEEILRALLARYLGDSNAALKSLLLSRVEGETAIAIEPRTLVSWDFSDRMEPVS